MSIACSIQRAAARQIGAIACAWLLGCAASFAQGTAGPPIWTVPEIGALPDDANGRLIRRGRDLVSATYAHIGPEVADPAKRFAGNNLACSNCHLNAGTKKFGIPLFGPGLDKDFPDLLDKPVDAPYGPYADGFGAHQHTYGPFAPIRAAIARLKTEKAAGQTPPR